MIANFPAALIIGVLSFVLFRWLYLRGSIAARVILVLTGTAMAIPAVLFPSNYVLLIPRAAWFREFHALPGVEVLSGLIGALLGIMFASSRLRPGSLNRSVLMVCTTLAVLLVAAPFGSQLFFRLNYSALGNEWKDGVCLQTSGNTCILASTATVIRTLGGHATEAQLARAAGTSYEGTEMWYYIRAIRKLGYEPYFSHLRSFRKAPVPSVIGVTFSSRGHAVAVLRRDADGVEIGDPRSGRQYYRWDKLPGGYYPDGLCITFKKNGR